MGVRRRAQAAFGAKPKGGGTEAVSPQIEIQFVIGIIYKHPGAGAGRRAVSTLREGNQLLHVALVGCFQRGDVARANIAGLREV